MVWDAGETFVAGFRFFVVRLVGFLAGARSLDGFTVLRAGARLAAFLAGARFAVFPAAARFTAIVIPPLEFPLNARHRWTI